PEDSGFAAGATGGRAGSAFGVAHLLRRPAHLGAGGRAQDGAAERATAAGLRPRGDPPAARVPDGSGGPGRGAGGGGQEAAGRVVVRKGRRAGAKWRSGCRGGGGVSQGRG